MNELDLILAKSINYGNISLQLHTKQVVETIEVFAKNFNMDIDIAIKGAVLHDLGKAHPHFQRKIKHINGSALVENRNWDYTHRHEISSLAFLPCFPKSEWDELIDMVIGHHKSIENDPSLKGILDLVETDRKLIDNHLSNWEEWSQYGLRILESFGLPTIKISRDKAEEVLLYVIDYCEKKRSGWSPWRGLLKSADHFASAFMNVTSEKLKPLFRVPNLNFYNNTKRKSVIYPLSQISTDDNRKHTLVVAPTGAGKTDFLIRRCKGRIFYTLPFQASINAMWERIKNDLKEDNPDLDIRLLHSTSRIVSKDNIDEQILQPLVGSSVKVLTPHQLAAIIFGISGFETVMLDLQGTDVILDEIHTYSEYSRAMVTEIVKTLLRLDCRIHIGTATMPSILYNELLKILGGDLNVYEVKLPDEILDTFDRHQIYKLEDEKEINPILKKAFENKEKILVIYNTVAKAQKVFENLQNDFPDIPQMLIHSRFRRSDRIELEKQLKSKFNGDNSNEFGNGFSPCLVVSTQVVEVSLDISFDRMITECAPLDSLIQRFGRINRKRTVDLIGKYKPVHIIKPKGNVRPYKMEILKPSFEQLPDSGNILKEKSLQDKINNVYPSLDTKEIEVHLIYNDDKYKIKELTNNKRAVLVEALEIESATCILESDREAYLTAYWEDRLQMEIPINYKIISRYKSQYEQLEVGSYPYVVPQNLESYRTFGLQLVEQNNFI